VKKIPNALGVLVKRTVKMFELASKDRLQRKHDAFKIVWKTFQINRLQIPRAHRHACNLMAMGNFTFWLKLLLNQFAKLKFGPSTYISQNVSLSLSLSENFGLRLKVCVKKWSHPLYFKAKTQTKHNQSTMTHFVSRTDLHCTCSLAALLLTSVLVRSVSASREVNSWTCCSDCFRRLSISWRAADACSSSALSVALSASRLCFVFSSTDFA